MKWVKTDLRSWMMALAAVLFGAVMPLAYAPYNMSVVAPLSVLGFYAVLQMSRTLRMATWIGFIYGFGTFAVGISWIHVSIDQFGGVPLIVSIALMILLCGYLALFPAMSGWLWYRICHDKPAILSAFAFPSIWLVTEYLRGELLTGFPWLAMGYSQTHSWLFEWAPIIGVQGIGWLVVFIGVLLTQTVHPKRLVWALPIIALVGFGTFKASNFIQAEHTGKFAKVALVQGNVPQIIKWDPESQWPTMRLYQDMSRPYYDHDIVVWPEAAIPAVELSAQDYLHNIDSTLAWRESAMITGIIDYQPRTRSYFNNLVVLGRTESEGENPSYYYGNSNRYSKHHLLPIGEFVPLGDLLRPLAPLFNLPMSSFSRGDYIQTNLLANGWKLAPALCYEILFTEQVRLNVRIDTDFIITVSNDAWFGDSIGPHQHLQIAQMRAKELARPVIRTTNNGITAIIDADGSITDQIPQFEAKVLSAEVNQYRGQTLFSRYGHYPIAILSVLSILIAAITRRRHSTIR
ncbi:apolipoprotein N-acyltransferase [Echinimonas agarilytica]|uniref:Apolipoprotein N-acyltransferase n=1 Tax=Echinimonas agarilytica TaxID=1215918 RepID=A0AA42B706_9GAMM|nr:apolipoprotein N-acyltransferase [Echinimonas agarilytica]MCM2679091.1 apolipoprotein N-acyltransferase [Echinimonas agarilytica]